MKGNSYSAEMCRPEALAGSPAEYRLALFLRRRLLQRRHDCRGVQILVRAIVPGDVQHAAAFHRAPHAVGDHGDGRVADLAHVTHAGNFLRFLVVEARHLPADRGTPREHRELHSRHAEVDAENRFAFYLGGRVDARQPLPDDLVVLALLERHVGRESAASRLCRRVLRSSSSGSSQRA